MNIWQLIIAGTFVHLVLFYSIFDIYFKSPLVHGMTPVSSSNHQPSQRLVLFVADGLRADRFFEFDENGSSRTPFLRQVIDQQGVWGVSHTRVPTESRPGHVALIAGFYEDVSAVAKGWKENPVEFDSVFNESRHTWSWGSPDILPMFAKGASGDHVTINCYPANFEDFAGSNMTLLDTWVFEQVKAFFASASVNSTLKKIVQEDKLVFFLHLLGIDTNGHSNKPHSREYIDNIRVVDQGVREMMDLIEDFYEHDKKTAYVLTADHGMTDWGSHGAGHAQETLTPFVAWGSGVRSPIVTKDCGVHVDTFCADWHLQTRKRCDIEQADVAPLMSYLVGLPLPLNSVGILPVDVLNATDAEKAEALLANAEQILAQFQVQMELTKKRTISTMFRPFQELKEADKLEKLKYIRHLIHNGHFKDAMSETYILIEKSLQGLRYYQTYDRFFLGASIVFGFLGWMCYILYLVVLEHTAVGQACCAAMARSQYSTRGTDYFFLALGLCIILLLYVQSLPLMCYLYCILPVILWWKSHQGWSLLYYAVRLAARSGTLKSFALSLFYCTAGLEIIILSFYHRELLSLGLLAMAAWPLATYQSQNKAAGFSATSVGWSLTCLLVAIFPLLPVVGRDTQYPLVIMSGFQAILIGIIFCLRLFKSKLSFPRYLWSFQLFLIGCSLLTVYTTSRSINLKMGLPLVCQACSWLILGLSCFLPLLSPTTLIERLFTLSLSFMATYLLLSITYEGFFFLSLLSLLYFWLRMEHESSGKTKQKFELVDFQQEGLVKDNLFSATFSHHLEISDLRRAFIFIFLILTAFFGTGNIASINSFDPASVYCFLTVFNPFLMGGLMMLKIMIPFLLVTCAFRGVHVLTRTPLRSLFLIVLIMSDFMGLHFFFLVRDYGSWLDIGATISHYVIVMVMIIFLLLLTGASHALTCWRVQLSNRREKEY